ncbi:uncharacterized protein LOC123526165 [Mercenaria mercenaria]|uniref:uncharacterized protein LOC123526165 n=1 Tax=Mercenaria mercenaria TaxID=6596 RepID=UPI00234E97ED|nr:uncharacterized protein LOC123526165 [Mercenaria mercenaria]
MVVSLLPLLSMVITTSRATSQCQSSIEGREFIFGIIQTARNSYYNTNPKSNDTNDLHIINASPNHNRIHLQIPYFNIDTYHDIPPDQSKTVNINPSIQKSGTFHSKRGIRITSDHDISVLVTCVKSGLNESAAVESYNVFPTRSTGRHYFISSGTQRNYRWSISNTVLVTSNVDNNLVTFYNTSTGRMNSTVIGKFDVYQYHSNYEQFTGLLIEAERDITVIVGVERHNGYYGYYGDNVFRARTISMIPTKYWANSYIVPQTRHADAASLIIRSEYVSLRVNISTNTHSSLSMNKNQSFVNTSVVLTAEKPFSISQNSFSSYHNNTNDDFMVLVPGVDQYINDYRFTVPHLYSNITQLHLRTKNYIAIIVPTTFKDDVLIDGVPVQYTGDSRTKKQFPVPSPFSNYTVLSFEISEGYHRVRHRLSHVKFGLLVYGLGTINDYWYSGKENNSNSYGFYAGFNLQGGQCEYPGTEPTTYSVPHGYTSSTGTKGPYQNNVTMCYGCEDLGRIDLCDTVKTCHVKEVCFVERQNKSGRMVYRSGCLAADVCTSEHLESLSKGNFCVECCSGSFCNNKGCGSTGLLNRDQRGPVCFDCQHVSSPELCTSVTLCSLHQVCRIEKLAWGEGYHYKMGCANSLCDPLTRSLHHLSKRATPVCHSCCNDDYCNKNCTRTTNGADGSVLVG